MKSLKKQNKFKKITIQKSNLIKKEYPTIQVLNLCMEFISQLTTPTTSILQDLLQEESLLINTLKTDFHSEELSITDKAAQLAYRERANNILDMIEKTAARMKEASSKNSQPTSAYIYEDGEVKIKQ